ncbi:MAG: hypothetical protein ACREQV_11435, partial [Candidatus Binatia bacterium]
MAQSKEDIVSEILRMQSSVHVRVESDPDLSKREKDRLKQGMGNKSKEELMSQGRDTLLKLHGALGEREKYLPNEIQHLGQAKKDRKAKAAREVKPAQAAPQEPPAEEPVGEAVAARDGDRPHGPTPASRQQSAVWPWAKWALISLISMVGAFLIVFGLIYLGLWIAQDEQPSTPAVSKTDDHDDAPQDAAPPDDEETARVEMDHLNEAQT